MDEKTFQAMQEVAPIENELGCFLDKERICGADCMSFVNPPAQDKDAKGQAWGHCLLLTNINRAGKHLAILARVGSDALEDARQPGIPKVR